MNGAAEANFPNTSTHVNLGKTGLRVCRIGIGGGSGLGSDGLEHALASGVNYVFHSSDLHPLTYARSRAAIRRVCRGGSRRRDEMVLATVSYMCDAEKLLGAVVDQLMSLRVDHVDVFHWGWVTRQNDPNSLLPATYEVLRTAEGRKVIEQMTGVARQVADELRSRGYARFLGISTHDRLLAAELSNHPLVDVVMFRYNIAHRGAEQQIFPALPADRPGTVAFNTTHNANGSLTQPPRGFPDGKYRPSYEDLYRFVLDRPEIDVVLTGPTTKEHVDTSLRALSGPPLDERVRAYLCKYGDVHSGKAVVTAPQAAG